MTKSFLLLLAATLALLLHAADSPETRGPEAGKRAFEKRCTGCHALDIAKVGPPLRGIFGRNAASDPHFAYSDALRNSHLRWDQPTLDRWLADPDQLVPNTDMSFRLENAADRKAIIDYLKSLPPPYDTLAPK